MAKRAPKKSAPTTPVKSSMEIVDVPVDSITPYPNNARVIPDSAIEKVAASITQYNWQQPIVVDKDMVIIIGHTRHLAAQRLGLEVVPVKIETNLTPNQVRLLRLADNRTNQESIWDNAKLIEEIMAIREEDSMDLDVLASATGFNEAELATYVDESTTSTGRDTTDRDESGSGSGDSDGSFPLIGDRPTEHQCPKCGTRFNDKGEIQAHVSGKRDASGAAPAANAKPGSRRRKPGAAAD